MRDAVYNNYLVLEMAQFGLEPVEKLHVQESACAPRRTLLNGLTALPLELTAFCSLLANLMDSSGRIKCISDKVSYQYNYLILPELKIASNSSFSLGLSHLQLGLASLTATMMISGAPPRQDLLIAFLLVEKELFNI